MQIESLSIQDFRSIGLIKLLFNKPINILCGENNAGKTTVLEAIYTSSNLRSFKSVPNNELIKSGSKMFKISLNYSKMTLKSNIFIEKSLKSSKCLYNNKKISKHNLSLMFPCYSLVFGFNNILLNDASYRRDFLDNGMFHVEPEAVKITLNYEKCLKQRNFLLKSKKYSLLQTWDEQLIDQNQLLTNMRAKYFDSLNTEFVQLINEMKSSLPSVYSEVSTLSLEYIKGWSGIEYSNVLKEYFEKDKALGYTTCGTHRSDIAVYTLGKPVKESGSMSTLVLACLIMNLAKMNVFHVKHGYKPTLLVDDLFFGIDDKNLSTVVKLLVHSKGNIVLTAPNIYMDILEHICKENDDIQLMNIGAKD